VAHQAGADVLTSRYRDVTRVLLLTLALNLLVAIAKLAFGWVTGTVSILSDGFHSLTDSASNVTALVGVRIARRPPDLTHPYGHRKFETLAAGAIFVFLTLVLVQILREAIERLSGETTAPPVTGMTFALLAGTLIINLLVSIYESRAGRRLKSELLLADSSHTRTDVYVSIAVILALIGVKLGYPILDPLAALVVAGFIGHAGFVIARDASNVLADHRVLDDASISAVVLSVPEVMGCHHIRTRGSADHVFLDLHVWFRADMRLDDAHRLSHVVKDRLSAELPSLHDIIIHIEPPPRDDETVTDTERESRPDTVFRRPGASL
jgi:cation diffusion facilitator family transporter